jgi:hypothetical protein
MEDVPRCLAPASLEKMTIACDKYDCVTAVSHSSMVWLQAGLDHYAPGDLLKLLYAAYVLDIPTAFAKISWAIVYRQTGPFAGLASPVEHELVEPDLLGEVCKRSLTSLSA